ncbi:putative membrane protein [Pedobacter sp. UYEF25]
MPTDKLSQMSNEELLKYQQSIKSVTYIFAVVLFFLFCLNTYNTFHKGFNALSVLPIALLPILIINFSTLRKIKEEILNRNAK